MFKFKPATITTFPLELSANWWSKIFKRLWLLILVCSSHQVGASDLTSKLQGCLSTICSGHAITPEQIETSNKLVLEATKGNNLNHLTQDQRENLRISLQRALLTIREQRNDALTGVLKPVHLAYTDLIEQLDLTETPTELEMPAERLRTISNPSSMTSPRSLGMSSPTRQLQSPSPTGELSRFSPWHTDACFTLLEPAPAAALVRKASYTRYDSNDLTELTQLARTVKLSETSVSELQELRTALESRLEVLKDYEGQDQSCQSQIETLKKFNNRVMQTLASKGHK